MRERVNLLGLVSWRVPALFCVVYLRAIPGVVFFLYVFVFFCSVMSIVSLEFVFAVLFVPGTLMFHLLCSAHLRSCVFGFSMIAEIVSLMIF